MLLSSLSIHSVRGTSKLKVANLAPVSLFVGANNAGKSTVLEASSILLRPHDPAHWIQTARHRDETMSFVDGLWSLFPGTTALQVEDGPQQTQKLSVGGEIHGVLREVSAQTLVRILWSDDQDAPDGDELVLTVDTTVRDGQRRQQHTLEFRREGKANVGPAQPYRCFTLTPGAHRSSRVLLDFLNFVVEAGTKHEAIQLLRLFDPQIDDIDISYSYRRPSVRVLHRARGVVDLASFGDGLRRAALFGMALRRAQDGVLMIDEIEGGIHTSALSGLLKLLVTGALAHNVQIIATTHSLEAVDAMLQATGETPDALAVYHLRRDETGHPEALRFDWARASLARDGGVDLR